MLAHANEWEYGSRLVSHGKLLDRQKKIGMHRRIESWKISAALDRHGINLEGDHLEKLVLVLAWITGEVHMRSLNAISYCHCWRHNTGLGRSLD